jgi:hypothetical protein
MELQNTVTRCFRRIEFTPEGLGVGAVKFAGVSGVNCSIRSHWLANFATTVWVVASLRMLPEAEVRWRAEMRRQIKLTTRRELTAAIRQRYQAADRNGKKLILDEFVKVTRYHCKHAIRLLTGQGYTQQGRPVGRRIYQEAVKEALIVLWEASDRICGTRLKALLPLLVEAMERHGHLQLQDGVKEQVLAISAATIDRLLRPVREKASGGRKRKSVQLNRVRKMVPVRTFADWEGVAPGYMEMDIVVHCGARLVGSFVHSLVLTDVASGWTECLALPVREQSLIVEAKTGRQR